MSERNVPETEILPATIDSSVPPPPPATSAPSHPQPQQSVPRVPMFGRLARHARRLPEIDRLEADMMQLSDPLMRKTSLSLRYRARSGESLAKLLPEAFALVREAGRRATDMRHFPVQLIGGVAMFDGCVAEMETGEGKTLTATLPLYLYALPGKGAHLATVNDYLAARDAELMTPIFSLLGMSVGVIQTQMSQDDRRRAYGCDVTYGTAKEFGFDFLRDRLLMRRTGEGAVSWTTGSIARSQETQSEKPVQRGMYYCLVDEADSILIDEARTPLIISAVPGEAQQRAVACYRWAAEQVDRFKEDEHFEYDHEKKTVELNFAGRHLTRTLPKPIELGPVGLVDIYQYIERAIKVGREFFLDRQYVVKDGEIVIVDEFTGRMAEGRKWSAGIHQSVEAKEKIEVTVETGHAARVTVQDLFRRYKHLSGMTGTAWTSAAELRKIYKTSVVRVPTNMKVRRKRLPARVYATAEHKWAAIVEEIKELHAINRPVLVGTRSIDKSELLSRLLKQAGVEHRVLNASQIAHEAEIVAKAGHAGKVTVATNMAGRGTDIKLPEGVAALGGLHVIGTEMHDSARIDRQLEGRCGRQGDPGTFQQYLATDDEILSIAYGPTKAERKKTKSRAPSGLVSVSRSVFQRAQRKIERRHFRGRKVLLYHEKHRKKMHLEMGQDPYLDMPDQ